MSSYYVLKIQYVNRPPETRNISAPTTTIGRESGDIVLNDPQTSGRHAEILFANGQVRCRDAGSTNGTWFNGQRLTEFVLEAGQWFQVGQTTLQLMAVHGAQPSAPAKTMMAMGAPPPAGGPGVPGSAPQQGWSPPGAPPPGGAPMGGPPPGGAPMGGPPPGMAPGGPPPGGPPPGGPPPGGPPPGMAPGGPPPGQPPMGAPPPGGPPMGGPPPGGQPPMGAPPMGAPPPGMQGRGPGGPPPGGPPMGGPPPGGPPMGGPPPGGPPMGGPPMGAPGGPPPGGPPPGGPPMGGPPPGQPPMGGPPGGPGGPGGYGGPGGPPPGGPPPGGPMPGAAPVGAVPVPGGAPGQMQPMGPGGAPMGAPPGGPPMAMGGGGVRPNFQGSGGELFVTFLVGGLLSVITFYIYVPWFMCKLARYVASNTTLGPTRKGELRMEFTGTGGELFVTYLVGGLLTGITFGIYAPWFYCKLFKFFTDNTSAVAPDGTRYRLNFEGTGGELFVTALVGALLTAITFYIYMPWFMCKLLKFFYSRTTLLENEQPVGSFDFEGTGGELFVTYLVGFLLTAITFYIYFPWFQVKLFKFFAEGTRINYQGRVFAGSFHGTGGEFFVLVLLHGFLAAITFYIYMPWFLVKQWQFQLNNQEFTEIGAAGAPPGMAPPAFQPQPHMPQQAMR